MFLAKKNMPRCDPSKINKLNMCRNLSVLNNNIIIKFIDIKTSSILWK